MYVDIYYMYTYILDVCRYISYVRLYILDACRYIICMYVYKYSHVYMYVYK